MRFKSQPHSHCSLGRNLLKSTFVVFAMSLSGTMARAEVFKVGEENFNAHILKCVSFGDFDAVTDLMKTPVSTATYGSRLYFADTLTGLAEDGCHILSFDMLGGVSEEDIVVMPEIVPASEKFIVTNDDAGHIVMIFVPEQSKTGESVALQFVVLNPSTGNILRSINQNLTLIEDDHLNFPLEFEPVFAINGDTASDSFDMFFNVRCNGKRSLSSVHYDGTWNDKATVYLLAFNAPELPTGDLPAALEVLNPGETYPMVYIQDAYYSTMIRQMDACSNRYGHNFGSNPFVSPYLRGICGFEYMGKKFLMYGSGISDDGIEVSLSSWETELPKKFVTISSGAYDILSTLECATTFNIPRNSNKRIPTMGIEDEAEYAVMPIYLSGSPYNDGKDDIIILSAYVPGYGLQVVQLDQKVVNAVDGIDTALAFTRHGDTVILTESADVRIYDSTGKLLRDLENTGEIDLSTLAHGVYIISASGGETFKVTR